MTRESELAAAIDHMDLSAVTGGLDAIGRGDMDADALWNAILSNGLAAAIDAALPEDFCGHDPEHVATGEARAGAIAAGRWPDAVSDGLALACGVCGETPRFDYRVTDEFWNRYTTSDERLGVVCLPCLDRRCEGKGLAEALVEVQWTGTGHTVVLTPTLRHRYAAALDAGSAERDWTPYHEFRTSEAAGSAERGSGT